MGEPRFQGHSSERLLHTGVKLDHSSLFRCVISWTGKQFTQWQCRVTTVCGCVVTCTLRLLRLFLEVGKMPKVACLEHPVRELQQ
jgi:hypothetical protein